MYKLIISLIALNLATACNISMRIVNQSGEPYYVEVTTPSGQKSPL